MSIVSQVKALGTREKLREDLILGPHATALGAMLENVSSKSRTKKHTLGEGAYGRVNLETINNTGNNVATKYFMTDDSDDFMHEIAAMRFLRGLPNVAQLAGVAPAKVGQPYPALIMAKGKASLDKRDNYKSWSDVFNVIVQVIRGYYVMHERKLAHRDTKPANMLITDLGEVYISDFGVTNYITAGTFNDEYTGTPIFSSPELLMINDLNIGESTPVNWFAHDAWAVGASLYYILTGKYFKVSLPSMYLTYGTPTDADGLVRRLFIEFNKSTRLPSKAKISIKDYIITKAKEVKEPGDSTKALIKSDEFEQLEQVAEFVARLLDYNPDNRPTMREILELPFMGGVPAMDPLPTLSITEYTLPAIDPTLSVTMRMYRILTGWLYEVLQNVVGKGMMRSMITTHMIVFDRTCIYILEILDTARKLADPDLTTRTNLQALGCLALYISVSLFGKFGTVTLNRLSYFTAGGASVETLKKILNRIMSYDIQFYGKTFYDELLEETDDPDMRWKLGLLNGVCYNKNYFKYVPKERLKELMMTHASLITESPERMVLNSTGTADVDFHPALQPFIDAVQAVITSGATGAGAVGGAYRKKTRKVKARKHRTRRHRK